jgi:hypothetical protein
MAATIVSALFVLYSVQGQENPKHSTNYFLSHLHTFLSDTKKRKPSNGVVFFTNSDKAGKLVRNTGYKPLVLYRNPDELPLAEKAYECGRTCCLKFSKCVSNGWVQRLNTVWLNKLEMLRIASAQVTSDILVWIDVNTRKSKFHITQIMQPPKEKMLARSYSENARIKLQKKKFGYTQCGNLQLQFRAGLLIVRSLDVSFLASEFISNLQGVIKSLRGSECPICFDEEIVLARSGMNELVNDLEAVRNSNRMNSTRVQIR